MNDHFKVLFRTIYRDPMYFVEEIPEGTYGVWRNACIDRVSPMRVWDLVEDPEERRRVLVKAGLIK